jgi:hypothetical protein
MSGFCGMEMQLRWREIAGTVFIADRRGENIGGSSVGGWRILVLLRCYSCVLLSRGAMEGVREVVEREVAALMEGVLRL